MLAGLLSGCAVTVEKSPVVTSPVEQPKAQKSIPSQGEIVKLVQGTMALFADAVSTDAFDNFDAFYGAISNLWKAQTTTSDLRGNFSDFIVKKIDLSFVKGMKPTFSASPVIDENGMLTVTGYYPSKKFNAVFTLGYVYEHPLWKLATIDVETKR